MRPGVRSDEIRRRFIDFFAQREHAFVPSSSTCPTDDPSLRDTFANAGMNQFKPVFLGQIPPGSALEGLRRAVNSQKCIRAGGKHNDLDDVGKDTYHHTFFEMLGNWSFGDYFKTETIAWAWELLTGELGLAPDRLYATYFGGDAAQGLEPDLEAKAEWERYLPPERVMPFGMKDNFWEMGETGPCGPCSEVHYDRVGGRDASGLVNRDDPDVLELWNLVFIQFERMGGGKLRPLPAKHVDTGMGLERLVSVLADVRSNYDTDVFAPIFLAIESRTDAGPYTGRVGPEDTTGKDEAYRVIADHVRTLTFALADGAAPSNEGRGYVLRRILRRAIRYGRQKLNLRPGFFAELVPVVIERFGAAYPELREHQARVLELVRGEEESFGRTLDRGIRLFEETAGRSETIVSGADAFKLYDTYGFPLDLTQLMAAERGLEVDVAGYEAAMREQQERSRAGGRRDEGAPLALGPDETARLARLNVRPTDDSFKFAPREIRATVKAIWNGLNFEEHADPTTAGTRRVGIVLDRTNFYAEMGGQVGDTGRMMVGRETRTNPHDSHTGGEFRVEDTQVCGGFALHVGRVTRGELRVGDDVTLHVEKQRRRSIAAHHTATHLLNQGLRTLVGPDTDQRGSLVAEDRLRFDFACNRQIGPEELARIEDFVRAQIEADLPVHADLAPLEAAQRIPGLRAVFGERYPDPVRVVSIGTPVAALLDQPEADGTGASIELCGGTHLESTGQAGAFALVSEEGIAKGIRRVTALAGVPARAAIAAADGISEKLAGLDRLDGQALIDEYQALFAEVDRLTLPAARKHELRTRLGAIQSRIKQIQKSQAAARASEAAQLAGRLGDRAAMTQEPVFVAVVELGSDRKALEAAMATAVAKAPTKAIMLFSTGGAGDKVAIVAAVPEGLVNLGLKAGDWVREAAGIMGGKGGGRATAAQGAGADASKLEEAIQGARSWAFAQVS